MFKVKTVVEVNKLIRDNFYKMKINSTFISSYDSYGYILSEDIVSLEEVPHFNRSTVDGYAVSSKITKLASPSIPVILSNLGEVLMGEESKYSINELETVYVPTGGHLPSGADSVVMIENTDQLGSEIIINSPTSKWENVLLKGFDIPFLSDKNKEVLSMYQPKPNEISFDIRNAVILYLKSL